MLLTHPWLLLGLLAVAIPIAIHLFELRRPKKLLFTNVGFIREVRLVTARQRKLKHLLVLLARIGFVVFLVLLFAQPYIPAPLEQHASGDVVGVVLDRSPSMQAGGPAKEAQFDLGVAQARELPNAYPNFTRFVLPESGGEPLHASAYKAGLDKLAISGRSASLGAVVQHLASGKQKATEVFIFSDFQKSSFSQQTLNQLDSTQQVFLVPLTSGANHNVFVDSIWLDDAFVRRNVDVLLYIRLRNGGTETVENCQVKLFVGDRQATTFRATVGTEPVTMTAQLRLPDAQLQKCRIELDDYPVSFDNTYYFSLRPSPKIKVLDVAGAETPSTQRLYANEPLFAYTRTTSGSLNYQALAAANLVVVQEQAQLSAGLRESLRRVVQGGGSVVLVPSQDGRGRASYDQLFRELGIGPVQWQETAKAPALRTIATPDYRNPFFRDVFGEQSRQPALPKVAPVLRWARSGTEILRLQDGDGFLAGFGSGRGIVYLFSAPFDAAYTDFTQHALFVPVMYRLAMLSSQRTQQPAYRLNQGTIAVPVETVAAQGEQVYKLTQDSLTFIPSQRLQAGTLLFDVPAEMRQPGFYTLTRAGKSVATLAFNNDKRESELAAYSADELRELIGSRKNVQVYDAGKGESVAARYKAERVGTPLWHYCLWAALACLLAEVLLLRFLNRTKPAEPVAVAA